MDWINWIRHHERIAWLVAGVSAIVSLGGVLAAPVIVTYLPADYFVNHSLAADQWRRRHPVIRWSLWTIKNVVGFSLAALGLVMLFAPGPGLLALLAGISLMSFPGKRRLEQRIVLAPAIRRQINALRARAGRPPLELPPGIDEPRPRAR